MNKIMIIVAHPDDETLGCGGLISKLVREKKNIFVLIVAEGSSCRFSTSASKHELEIQKLAIKKRSKMLERSMHYLGVQDICELNLRCGALSAMPLIEINQLIEKPIRAWQPDTVITHSYIDSNLDHQTVFESVRIATRPTANSTVKTVLSCEIPSSTDWSFVESFSPNYFIELDDDDLTNKIEALKFYEKEIPGKNHPRSLDNIKALAKIRGSQVGVEYAEAFCLIRHSME